MRTATVADLRNHFPKIAAWLAAGEEVRVTRRGKPLARILPHTPEQPPERPDFAARRKAIFGEEPVLSQANWGELEDEMARGTIEDRHGL